MIQIRETERLTAQATPAECIAYGLAEAIAQGNDKAIDFWLRSLAKLEGNAE